MCSHSGDLMISEQQPPRCLSYVVVYCCTELVYAGRDECTGHELSCTHNESMFTALFYGECQALEQIRCPFTKPHGSTSVCTACGEIHNIYIFSHMLSTQFLSNLPWSITAGKVVTVIKQALPRRGYLCYHLINRTNCSLQRDASSPRWCCSCKDNK